MSTTIERTLQRVVEGGHLVRSMKHDDRAKSRTCPGCGELLSRTALIRLAYVFTRCSCELVEYEHLYEQLWHIDCLRKPEATR